MIRDSELDLGKLFVNELVDRGTGWKVIGGLYLTEASLSTVHAFLDSAVICSNIPSPSCLLRIQTCYGFLPVLGVPLNRRVRFQRGQH